MTSAERLLEHFAASIQGLREEARRTRELGEKYSSQKHDIPQTRKTEEAKDAQSA